jgi:hypothetical protein
MPTTVRDASLVTTRNRNIAEFSYYTAWKNETANTPGNANFALKQPVVGGANSVSEVTLGGIATNAFNNEFLKSGANPTFFSTLGYDSNVALYPPNPSSGGAGRTY